VSDRVQIRVPVRNTDPPLTAAQSDSTSGFGGGASTGTPTGGDSPVSSEPAPEPAPEQPAAEPSAPETEHEAAVSRAAVAQAPEAAPRVEAGRSPARRSLGLVIFIVAIGAGIVTAVLKGTGVLSATRRPRY
jgi:hypothetical protein